MRKARAPIPLERDIAKACVAYLESVGCYVERRQNVQSTREYKGKIRRIRAGKRAYPDWHGSWPEPINRAFDVEVKRPGQWPRQDQIDAMVFLNTFTSRDAFWVHSVAMLVDIVGSIRDGLRPIVTPLGYIRMSTNIRTHAPRLRA